MNFLHINLKISSNLIIHKHIKSLNNQFWCLRCYNDVFNKVILTQVTVGENEGIESALRRFKRQVSKAGIFADLKRLRHHETPIEKYKRKLQQRRKARRR